MVVVISMLLMNQLRSLLISTTVQQISKSSVRRVAMIICQD